MFNLGAITGSNAAAFDPDKEISSLNGKVILVTGGSSGLGKQAVIFLARQGAPEIWLTAQTSSEGEKACEDIRKEAPDANIRSLSLNLASFKSIRDAATKILTQITHLDILMLNAGVMGTPPDLTEDGYETQFGINYMGHVLLTRLLLPLLNKTATDGADVRVIVSTSYSHWNAPKGGIQFESLKTRAEELPSLQRYAQSKLANILFVRQLAKQHPKLTVASVHPGAADTPLQAGSTDTGLIDRTLGVALNKLLLYQPIETVAKNQVWAATTTKLVSGEYYEPLGLVGKTRDEAADERLAKKLWDWTEVELEAWDSCNEE